ncbi:fungal-specific transcription factor domain-containing protein [Lipomyces tetrasporus]
MASPATAVPSSTEAPVHEDSPGQPAPSPSESPAMPSQSVALAGSASVIKPGSSLSGSIVANHSVTIPDRVGAASRSPAPAANNPTSAELRKLKRRVDPAKRKRIALACDSCKRRKQKCNGDHPCSICQKKNFLCHYTPAKADLLPARTPSIAFSSPSPHTGDADDTVSATPEPASDHLKYDRPRNKRHHSVASQASTENSEEQATSSKHKDMASRKPNVSNESSLSESFASNPASPDTSVPSPPEVQLHQQQQRYHRKRSHSRSEYQVETVGDGRNTRLLWDEKGHLRYMGESGVLSFLEQSRKAFRKVMGDSSFTLDPAQFRFIDGPTHTASIIPLQLPPRSLTNELIQAFEDNVQAFDYVFDMDHFRYQVAQTYRNPMGAPRHWLCLLHFTCALGAIFVSSKHELDTDKLNIPPFSGINDPRPGGASIQNNSKESSSRSLVDPALFFESGLGLMNDAAEDGELWVVQAYLLMCLYYQIICKRNASWIQLGSAIRFAQALGMHRKCVNMTFPKPQRIVRQRLWRTLYIQDRFWSSSLGRPLAIDDCDWDDRDATELILLDRTVVELSKLCEIIGDICLLVYRPRSISSSTSQRLATRLREWSDGLPPDIQLSSLHLNTADGRKLSVGSIANEESRRQMIRNQGLLRLHLTHLNSIILLTRPFFLLMVAKTPSEIPAQAKTVSRLSSACVLCAARSVDLVMTFFAQNQQPIRSHLMTYFIFTAGIVLLLESFHQRSSEVESYITRGIFLCIFILGHYGKCDPSAKRYRNILQEMDRAARASRTLNYTNAASTAAADSQKKHMSQISSILNNNEPAMPITDEMPGSTYFMPTPRNSSVRSELGAQNTVDESAAAAAAAAAAAQAYQQAANPDYEDEKYLHDMLGYGYNNIIGSDSTANLSRMFLKAAANDGRYQIPDSPVVGVAAPAITASNDDDRGIALPSSVPSFMPPPATTAGTSSSKEGPLNISPADAMSQFLMDDTFSVSGGGSDEPNMEFSFDLDMMDWINLASSSKGANNSTVNMTGNNSTNHGNNPAGAVSSSGPAGFDEVVRRANAELFNGPGGARQGVGATTSAGQAPLYGNDTVFRGLMMNAEY